MKAAPKSSADARSQRLFNGGFTSLNDARACLQALANDLEGERISAAEANAMTAATGRWMRDFDKTQRKGK